MGDLVQVITISNGNARRTTNQYQEKLHKLALQHKNIHHYSTKDISDIPGVLDDVKMTYGGQRIHFVKVSGDGGYHQLITALANHDILEDYPHSQNGYCFPEDITISPTGHGTQNVVARFAGIRPGLLLSRLPLLANTPCSEYVNVQLLRTDEQGKDTKLRYGFMFSTGPAIDGWLGLYKKEGAGSLGAARVIMKSILATIPGVKNAKFLEKYIEALNASASSTLIQDGKASKVEFGAFLAAAESFKNGPLQIWQKQEGKVHALYGGITGLRQGIKVLYQLSKNSQLTVEGITNVFTEEFTLEDICGYALDDEHYPHQGKVKVSKAGTIRIPKLLL